jgi:hypothetical protein
MDPVFTPEDVYRSYQTRDVDFEDDDGHTTLGQKNHGNDTRTKITHRGGLGFGIIGTVLGVQYGKWRDDKPAMLLLMRFHFRLSDNVFRLRRAEISVRFDSRKAAVHPELRDLRQFYPKRRELGKTKPVARTMGSRAHNQIHSSQWLRRRLQDNRPTLVEQGQGRSQ